MLGKVFSAVHLLWSSWSALILHYTTSNGLLSYNLANQEKWPTSLAPLWVLGTRGNRCMQRGWEQLSYWKIYRSLWIEFFPECLVFWSHTRTGWLCVQPFPWLTCQTEIPFLSLSPDAQSIPDLICTSVLTDPSTNQPREGNLLQLGVEQIPGHFSLIKFHEVEHFFLVR